MLHRQRRMAGFGALVFLLHASAYVPLHPPARPGLRLFAPARSGPQMCDSLDLPPDARGTGGRTRRKRAKAVGVADVDIEEAEDADDSKSPMIALILAHDECVCTRAVTCACERRPGVPHARVAPA